MAGRRRIDEVGEIEEAEINRREGKEERTDAEGEYIALRGRGGESS
jgi:hypothetical protein